VTDALLALLLFLTQVLGQPRLSGLATWYDYCVPPACVFRSGEAWSDSSPSCAVDTSLWPELKGKRVLVLTQDCRTAILRVNDTGYLYAAGYFQRGAWTWQPAESGQRFVIDVPAATYRRVFGTTDTRRVWLWILD